MTRIYQKTGVVTLLFTILLTAVSAQPGSSSSPNDAKTGSLSTRNPAKSGSSSLPHTAATMNPIKTGGHSVFNTGPGAGYRKEYVFLHSDNLVADKNFYWLTVIGQDPVLRQLLAGNETLRTIHDRKLAILKSHVTDTCTWAASLLADFRWTSADSLGVSAALHTLYEANKAAFDKVVDQHLRPSGYYQRFIAFSNEDLLLHAWGQTVVGINYIIDQFGLGRKMRYPLIDSASYDVNSRYYRTVLKDIFAYLSEFDNFSEFAKLSPPANISEPVHLSASANLSEQESGLMVF